MRFVVFLSVVTAALAQRARINTPDGVLRCHNQQITWAGGVGPFTIEIIPDADPNQVPLETIPITLGNSYSWYVTEPANTKVYIRLRDATGIAAESGTFTIGEGGTCTSALTIAPASSSGVLAPPATTRVTSSTSAAAKATIVGGLVGIVAGVVGLLM